MNKLRLIKIYELKGKVHPIEEAFVNILDCLKTYDEGMFTRYKNKTNKSTYFSYLNNNIFIYPILRKLFLTRFKCSNQEMTAIVKYLLEKHLKLVIGIVYE